MIFKKRRNLKGIIIYKPVDIVVGYLDKDAFQFVTKRDSYHYLTEKEYLYGYGLRSEIKQLKKEFSIYNLKEFVRFYLDELKKYTYYFSVPKENDFENLVFMAEHKVSHHCFQVEDKDIKRYKKEILNSLKLTFDAQKLSDGIKSEVIAQDKAIDQIITILWQNFQSNHSKSNILLIGPTGVGKTEIIRNISKRLDIPMVTVNAADLTQTGYLGASASDCLKRLIKNANYNLEKASRGIVFIDEIDKKAGTGEYNTGIASTGVQDELLKLLEDGDYEINISEDLFIPKNVTLNTKHITFICSGAFQFLLNKESEKVIAGFSREPQNQTSIPKRKEITHNDLIKTKLIKPELVGRLHNIIELNPLNKEDLIAILKNPNNKTIQEKIGARGLIPEIDKLFMEPMPEISHHPNDYQELIMHKDILKNPKSYTLVRKKKEE